MKTKINLQLLIQRMEEKRKDQGSPTRISQEFKRNKNFKKYYSSYECYTCHKLGHISIYCPHNTNKFNTKNKKFHAHAIEENDLDEERIRENENFDEEYVLVSALTGSISHGSDTWIIDSGSSKHMIGHIDYLSCLTQKYYPHKVQLGDDYQYPIKGMGEASYKMKSGKSMKMKEVLYVPV